MYKNKLLNGAACLSLMTVLTACSTAPSRDSFAMPGQLVSVGAHKLHLYCSGSGDTTVVLESGAGIGSSAWQLVQEPLAEYTRVCSYDRAGLVWSERRRGRHSADAVANELHALLESAGEKGNLVLVGHSLGGIYSRRYAELYLEQVMALVLVDSSHPDQEVRGLGIFGMPVIETVSVALAKMTGYHRKSLNLALATAPREIRDLNQAWLNHSLAAMTKELDSVPAVLDAVAGANSLGDLPLTVIAAERQYQPDYGLNPQRDPDTLAEEYRRHRELQQDLLNLSSRSTLRIAERSGHNVPFEQPEIIVEAVVHMLEERQ